MWLYAVALRRPGHRAFVVEVTLLTVEVVLEAVVAEELSFPMLVRWQRLAMAPKTLRVIRMLMRTVILNRTLIIMDNMKTATKTTLNATQLSKTLHTPTNMSTTSLLSLPNTNTTNLTRLSVSGFKTTNKLSNKSSLPNTQLIPTLPAW